MSVWKGLNLEPHVNYEEYASKNSIEEMKRQALKIIRQSDGFIVIGVRMEDITEPARVTIQPPGPMAIPFSIHIIREIEEILYASLHQQIDSESREEYES